MLLALISALAVLSSHILPTSVAVAQHALFSVLEVTLFLVLLKHQMAIAALGTFSSFVPAGASLVVPQGDTNVTTAITQQFRSFLAEKYTWEALGLNLMLTTITWPFLAIMGLNWWAVVVDVFVVVATFTVALLPGVAHLNVVLRFVFVALLEGVVALFLAASIERTRRSMMLAETLLTRELQASQMADNILNHTLKNILADVAGNIELYVAGMVGREILADAVTCLNRGMKSCKERSVYLKLVAGEYTPIMNVVNLQEFGHQLIAGRNALSSFVDLSVYLDCTLLNLIMDNGISNAFKHGRKGAPNVCVSIAEVHGPAVRPGFRRFCFSVTNDADPTQPCLTPDHVRRLFAGKAELKRGAAVPRLSDRIGLPHCALAAKAGGFDVALRQEGHRIVFSVELDTDVFEGQRPPVEPQGARRLSSSDSLGDDAPPAGLVFAVLDDSVAAQRLLEFHLQRWWSPAHVLSFGATAEDVEEFVSRAVADADVVILDQHLEYPSGGVLGTDVVTHLLRRQYRGLVCIRSAADSPEDRQRYAAAGAHITLGKDVRGRTMVEELKAAFLRVRVAPSPSMISFTEQSDVVTRGVCVLEEDRWARLMPATPPTDSDGSDPPLVGHSAVAPKPQEVVTDGGDLRACPALVLPGRVTNGDSPKNAIPLSAFALPLVRTSAEYDPLDSNC